MQDACSRRLGSGRNNRSHSFSNREYPDAFVLRYQQQSPVSRQDAISITGERRSNHNIIVWIGSGTRNQRGRYDGDYDKAGLPDELILTNYFTVEEGRIVSLFVIRNRD